jgi:hypothetical protein
LRECGVRNGERRERLGRVDVVGTVADVIKYGNVNSWLDRSRDFVLGGDDGHDDVAPYVFGVCRVECGV